jgi:DUF971 family protein
MNFEPTHIDVNENFVKMTWADGSSCEFPAQVLRAACNCASCVSEVTGERTLNTAKISPQIKITHAEPTGNYALTLHFSDFHKTGIFTYESLYQLAKQFHS